MDFQNQTYAVLGLARSGLASVQWLLEKGATVFALDDDAEREEQAHELGAHVALPEDINWSTITALVHSPGIPFTYPEPHPVTQLALQHNVPIITDLDLLRNWASEACFIGITGTNGKSTTTALVGHILAQTGRQVAVGGNIGRAALSLPYLGQGDFYVLELSSYQLELSPHLNLDVAALLNISVDHLDRHGSMEAYAKAKTNIFDFTTSSQTQVVCLDDDYTKTIAASRKNLSKVSTKEALEDGVFVEDKKLFTAKGGERINLLGLWEVDKLKGPHNHQNIAVAYAICQALGLPAQQILEGIKSFPGLVHRQEVVREIDGIQFINDSKATNSDAVARALDVFDNIYWIVGGRSKADGIHSLLPYASKIIHAYLIGDAAPEFAITLNGVVPFTICGDLETAVTKAYDHAAKSTIAAPIVLLSPACSSFDQFRDFEHRGDCFKHVVSKLKPLNVREKIA